LWTVINFKYHYSRAGISKVNSADAKESTTSSQDISRYIYVVATLKFAWLEMKGILFCAI